MRNVDQLDIRDTSGGAIIAVKAVAGSSREGIVGVLGDALKVATAAPAEKGKANAAIARTLAKALGISPGSIELVSGPTNPRKEFRLAGLSAADIRDRL